MYFLDSVVIYYEINTMLGTIKLSVYYHESINIVLSILDLSIDFQ